MITLSRRRFVAAVCLAVVVGIVIGLLMSRTFGIAKITLGDAIGTGAIGTGATGDGAPTDSFTISGDLSEMIFPGSRVPLDLTISNGSAAPMIVTNLRVLIKAVDAPNASARFPCSVNDFTVNQVATDFEAHVAAKSSSTLRDLGLPTEAWPTAGMLDATTNQDGCKGASLTLAYDASGRLLK
jgi:hypothetical protein